MSWPKVPLGELMATRTLSLDPAKFPDEEFELWSIPAFDAGAPEAAFGSTIGSAKKVIEPNDILLSRIVPHIRRSWVVAAPSAGRRQIASSEWIIFRSARIDPPYLRHVLLGDTFHAAFMGTVAGIGGSLLRARPEAVKRIEIALPPLAEQRRIAAILDQADALRRLRRQSLSRLSDLGQAIFFEMFGDPALNPKGFRMRPLRDVASKFSDGPFGSNLKSAHYVDDGVRVIRLQNIGVNEFVDDDAAYISPEHFASLRKHECLPGDILVGTLGDPNLRACIQPGWLPQALNKADCVQIRVDSTTASNEYVCALLNIPSVEKMAHSLVLGQTRARISMGRLRELLVPVAPKDLQDQFAAVIAKQREKIHLAENAARSTANLFASLQHRAFRGEL